MEIKKQYKTNSKTRGFAEEITKYERLCLTCKNMYLATLTSSFGECIWCWYDRIFRKGRKKFK